MYRFLFSLMVLVCVSASWAAPSGAQEQEFIDQLRRTAVIGQAIQRTAVLENQEQEKQPKIAEPDEETIDTASLGVETIKLDDQFVKFHLWDGSIIGGLVQNKTIDVRTDFGPLVVPVARLVRFYPGAQSLPEIKSELDLLVKQLDDKSYDVREKAQKALISKGTLIRGLLNGYGEGNSAESRKRLADVKSQLDQMSDELEDDESSASRTMIAGDLIETPDFDIVGKIQNSEFEVKTKFGMLVVQLSDIEYADRSFNKQSVEIKKTVEVNGDQFFQKGPVSSRIRVNKGDRIKIFADGSVNWTNWGTTSSPDGLTNHGSYKGVNGGALAAMIGKSGDLIKIGVENEFVSRSAGTLFLGVAMQDSYAKQNGYRWTGKFKVKIRVTSEPR
ncbi:MAG: hypothetical protein AAF623_14445 [Planctomycetota bacterium]